MYESMKKEGEGTLLPGRKFDPDKHDRRPRMRERMIMRAELESMWSTCRWLRVGAVAYDADGDIIISGYNGAPRKQKHCMNMPAKEGRCQYCVHAETNLTYHAAKLGVSISGANIATLYRPCVGCANALMQVGVAAVYYRHSYDSDGMYTYVEDMLRSVGTYLIKMEPTPAELEYSQFLQEWSAAWNGTSPLTSLVVD